MSAGSSRRRAPSVVSAALIAAAVAAAGCQYDPHTAIFATVEPRVAEVAGEYVLSESTRGLVADAGYEARTASIRLDADGTFTFTDVPDWEWEDREDGGRGFVSGHGTWRIRRKQEKWWAVDAWIRETTAASAWRPSSGGFVNEWVVADDAPPHRLVLTIGDPDEGRAMIFERSDPHGR